MTIEAATALPLSKSASAWKAGDAEARVGLDDGVVVAVDDLPDRVVRAVDSRRSTAGHVPWDGNGMKTGCLSDPFAPFAHADSASVFPAIRLLRKEIATRMTKKSAITIAFLVGLTTIALPAAPASASTPQCTTKKVIWDDRGDAQITVPVSTSGSDNCWLAKGDISSAVGALQAALKYCNGWQFASLAVDNNYGPATKAAVTDFQQGYADAGDPISVDGVYGPQSKAYMAFPDVGSQYCDYAP